MFVLCINSALHTHISNIAVFAHQDRHMKVATGKFQKFAELSFWDGHHQVGDLDEVFANQILYGLHEKIQ